MRQVLVSTLERFLGIAVGLAGLSVLGLSGWMASEAGGDTRALLGAVAVLLVGGLAVLVLGGCGYLAVYNARNLRRVLTFVESGGRSARPLTATRGPDERVRPAAAPVAPPPVTPVAEPQPRAAQDPAPHALRQEPGFAPRAPLDRAESQAPQARIEPRFEPAPPAEANPPAPGGIFSPSRLRQAESAADDRDNAPQFGPEPPLSRNAPAPVSGPSPAQKSGRLVADRRPPR